MTAHRLIIPILAAFLVLAPSVASAGTDAKSLPHKKHRVRRGDTLQLLAAEYYGDRRHAVFIMMANRLAHKRKLKNGEVLIIPIGVDVTSRVGDDWKTLAKQHLGHEKRAGFLAKFNGAEAGSSLAAGEVVHIPLQVTHKAQNKVDIAQLAATYLADRRKASFLKEYNFLDKAELQPGESIVIPIQRVRVRPDKLPAPDAESRERIAKRREMQSLARKALVDARSHWRRGSYRAIRKELAKVDTNYLDADWALEIGVLLGSAYIALDDKDSALATFNQILERQPNHILSMVEYSPKILEVWKEANGEVVEPPK